LILIIFNKKRDTEISLIGIYGNISSKEFMLIVLSSS